MINLRYRLTLEELVKVDRLLTKQKEIALRMLQENIPLDVIARITQLTISELEGCTYGRLLQRQRVITIDSPANMGRASQGCTYLSHVISLHISPIYLH